MDPDKRQLILRASERFFEENVHATAAFPTYDGLMKLFEEGRDNVNWYKNVLPEAERLWGKADAPVFIKLLAATSPRTDAPGNANLAIQIMLRWRAGESVKDIKRLINTKRKEGLAAVFGVEGDPFQPKAFPYPLAYLKSKGLEPTKSVLKKGEFGRGSMAMKTMENNIEAALTGGELSGYKVNAFAENMSGNLDRGTIDTWMLKAFGFFSEQERISAKTGLSSIAEEAWQMTDERLSMVETWMQGLAKEAGVKTAEMQAALWVAQKMRDARKSAVGGMRLETPGMMGRPFDQIIREEAAIAVQKMEQLHKNNPAIMEHLKQLAPKVKEEMGLLMAMGAIMAPLISKLGMPSQANLPQWAEAVGAFGTPEETATAVTAMQQELPPQ
jgi:hypothetical protein